jgi:hypothetical protein
MNTVLVGKYLFEGRCLDCFIVEKRFQGFFGILVPNFFSLFSSFFINGSAAWWRQTASASPGCPVVIGILERGKAPEPVGTVDAD